jgi:FG-GAP-like repeat
MRPPTGRARITATAAALALCAGATATAAHAAAPAFQRTDYTVGGQANSLAVGDVDGKDGPDLVAVRYAAGTLVRRLNDGHGGFTTGGQAYPACKADQVELADVTTNGTDFVRDGKLDALLFCTDDGKLARMAGDGAGGFGVPHLSSLFLNSPALSGADHFAVGRITSYERPPLVVFRTQDGSFRGLLCTLYDYDADSACLAPYPAWPAIGGPMVLADFQGDGVQEVVTLGGTGATGHVVVFGITDYPLRQWSFSEAAFGHNGGGGGATLLTAGDLRGDGHPDLVTGWSTSSEGWVNTIDPSNGAASAVPREFPSIAGLSRLVTGDYDGDGRLDVLAVSGYGRAVVHSGDAAGGLGAPQDVPLIGYGNPAYATVADAVAADVDRNGTADAVVLDELAGAFEVLRNLAPPPAPTPGPPSGGGPGGPTQPGGPGPKPTPVPPFQGVTHLTRSATLTKLTAAFTIGRAANPPARSVAITLAVAAAKGTSSATKKARTTTVARATIAIPAGRTRALAIRLNAKGRALLRRRGRLVATATLVATGTDGAQQTRKRTITLKRRR